MNSWVVFSVIFVAGVAVSVIWLGIWNNIPGSWKIFAEYWKTSQDFVKISHNPDRKYTCSKAGSLFCHLRDLFCLSIPDQNYLFNLVDICSGRKQECQTSAVNIAAFRKSPSGRYQTSCQWLWEVVRATAEPARFKQQEDIQTGKFEKSVHFRHKILFSALLCEQTMEEQQQWECPRPLRGRREHRQCRYGHRQHSAAPESGQGFGRHCLVPRAPLPRKKPALQVQFFAEFLRIL